MRLKPFEYICLLHPAKDKDGNEVGMTEIIVERTMILVQDDKIAAMAATRAIDAKYDAVLNLVEIIVRPF